MHIVYHLYEVQNRQTASVDRNQNRDISLGAEREGYEGGFGDTGNILYSHLGGDYMMYK